MSGRSAHVRAKKVKATDDTLRTVAQEHEDDGTFIYGFSGLPISTLPSSPSFSAAPPVRRRQSISSGGSTYAYPPLPIRKLRPIVVASAIERSDFRTHLDGMSKSVRGKLGRLMKGGEESSTTSLPRLPTTVDLSDTSSRSTGTFTPSITAVPALSPDMSLSSGSPDHVPAAHVPDHVFSYHARTPSKTPRVKRFVGGGKTPQDGWKSLANNPELWDQKGDTLVYMYMRDSKTKPPPSFRIKSRVIYESGSAAFIGQLRDRSVPHGWPRFAPADMPSPPGSDSPDGTVSSFELPRQGFTRDATSSDYGGSDSTARRYDPYLAAAARTPNGILHEIYVPWPGKGSGVSSTMWHITTRNFFAVMYDSESLIGTTLYEALTELLKRLTAFPDYLDRNVEPVEWITDYIKRHQFHDVRNNPSLASSILAFSELPNVHWREGYIEGFIHCVGMLTMGLESVPEWNLISPHTKMYIKNASLEMEERIHRAQRWLFSFDFTEMWSQPTPLNSSAHTAFERLRKWLCKYYEKAFLHWPPTVSDSTWLTHDMVTRLRTDFHGLYDYLVDRAVHFDSTQYRPGQKWVITSTSGQPFRADTTDLPFTSLLLAFDDRNRFPHIPHPYPLIPPSMPHPTRPKPKPTKPTFLKKTASASDLHAHARRKALSYADASNIYLLRGPSTPAPSSELVANFLAFEQADHLDLLDPFDARRGRWLLVYAVLQVLATVAVDSPLVCFADGVQYHLSPQMKGVVPWAETGAVPEEEARHERSHPFVVAGSWPMAASLSLPLPLPLATRAREGPAYRPILCEGFGDGRGRVEEGCGRGDSSGAGGGGGGLGWLRAREWVVNTNANGTLDGVSEFGLGLAPVGLGEREREGGVVGRKESFGSGSGSGSGGSGVGFGAGSAEGVEVEREREREAARRRRARIHGFTDFKVPEEW